MAQIVSTSNFNPAALQADDLYVVLVPPPSFIVGVPTGVAGVVGTASWGPVNTPVFAGSPQQFQTTFGAISAASLTDPYDMATDATLAFNQSQGSQSAFQLWGVRITDGTDTASTVALVGSETVETVTVGGTLSIGDVLHVTVTLPSGAVTVNYTTASGNTTTDMATGIKNAINADTTLIAAHVTATSSGAVVTIHYPTTSPATTFGQSVTGSTETLTLASSTNASTTGATLAGLFTGVLGNQLQAKIAAGSINNTLTVTLVPFSGGNAESYPNIPSAGTTFWQALQSAINNGVSGYRGPSALMKCSGASYTVGAPAVGTYSLTGGTDGRAGVTSATVVGTNTNPPTGMYALQGLSPAPGVVWFAGLTDTTVFSTVSAFVDSIGAWTTLAFPAGTTSATALTDAKSLGIADYNVSYNNFGAYFFDSANNQVRLVQASPIIAGLVASLGPQQSPGNKPVYGIIGNERNSPVTGNLPFTNGEIGQLESAGILFLSNPIPAGSVWGCRHGQNTAINPAQNGVNYARMTNYLALSLADSMGQFVDELQSTQQNDPLRLAVNHALNDFGQQLVGAGQIDSYLVTCVFSANGTPGAGVNTSASVAQGYLYAMFQAKYLGTARFFVLALQGGTTVVTSGGTLNQALSQ